MVEDDPDYLLLRISADNGEFSGTVDVYLFLGGPAEFAAKLEGFPKAPSDRREIVVGSFGTQYAGGGAKLLFFCSDNSGHAWVEVQIEAGDATVGVTQSARVIVPIEAAAVDDFVQDLLRMNPEKWKTAVLKAVPGEHYKFGYQKVRS